MVPYLQLVFRLGVQAFKMPTGTEALTFDCLCIQVNKERNTCTQAIILKSIYFLSSYRARGEVFFSETRDPKS